MPTTSNFGWTTPADTDLVKDGALAIRTLGNGIDTSLVDLKGGTTGQNLRKASDTDLDFTFAGDATNTVVDAAGDLLYGTAADTLGRLAIGTAGQVLKVNSGATAPEWGAASTAFVGASVYKSTTQAITNNTATAITFDLENFDTDAFHSNVTNNSRLTIPVGKAGKYLVTGVAAFASNSTGIRRWIFYKNGSAAMNIGNVSAASAGDTRLNGAWLVDLAEGDYVEFFCIQTSGGNLNISGNAADVFFGIQFLGA